MSITASEKTLRGQLRGRPLNMNRVLANALVSGVCDRLDALGATPVVAPETHALTFYMLEHAVAMLKRRYALDEPLPKEALAITEAYNTQGAEIMLRAFYYVTAICVRESRHTKNKGPVASYVKKTIGVFDWAAALGAFPDQNSVSMVTAAMRKHCAGVTLGQLFEALVYTFNNGSFSHGYGGKAWGAIAQCGLRFVTGETTPAMFLDTVWTLAHNGGPIFNKGMFYQHYDSAVLMMILDLQHAGQIPNAVVAPTNNGHLDKKIPPSLRALALSFGPVLGAPFEANCPIDWAAVVASHPKGNYTAFLPKTPAASEVTLAPGLSVKKAPRPMPNEVAHA